MTQVKRIKMQVNSSIDEVSSCSISKALMHFLSPRIAKNHYYQDTAGKVITIKVLKRYIILKPRMNKIIKLLDSFICKHQKVFALRFDLHHSVASIQDSNCQLSDFLKRLNRKLAQYYKTKPAIVWSCERGQSHRHHYHLALLMNGNKVNSPIRPLQIIKQLWSEVAGGHNPSIPNAHYNLVRQNSEQFWLTLQALFVRLSYLAKSETDYRPSKVKFSFGMSHIRYPEDIRHQQCSVKTDAGESFA